MYEDKLKIAFPKVNIHNYFTIYLDIKLGFEIILTEMKKAILYISMASNGGQYWT